MDSREILLYVVSFVIFAVFLTAAVAGIKAAPFVPTFQRDVRRMLKLADVKADELVIDLGAGDGRFLVTAATEFGARGLGYEFSILPYAVARLRIWLCRLTSTVKIVAKDFYRQDLSKADVITCFLTPMAMKKLEPKFRKELKPGTRVVSYAFQLPTWPATAVDKPTPTSTSVFLYKV